MLFTSVPFALFFLAVFILYWMVFNGKTTCQNTLLLIGSYFFYGMFEWKFAVLLLIISLVNYSAALLIGKKESRPARKTWLLTAVIIDVATLILFKYYNFFTEAFTDLFPGARLPANLMLLHIMLPVGISFYIFLSMSYVLDVYRKKITAVSNPADVLLAFSFFPIILAGPIHRPAGLLPQIRTGRTFSYALAADGVRQILWGLFMKILIADHCATYVNEIFGNFQHYPGSMLLTGVILFTVQIYADFAGYSHLAIGLAKLLGFRIMQNFAYPYFARDIREFWRRWNISLTTWFRDYVFLPVAYAVSGRIRSERVLWIKSDTVIYTIGITVTWMLTGLWHGANYTFLVWGLIQGFFLLLYHISIKPRKKLLSSLKISNGNKALIFFESAFTLVIVMGSLLFFRSESVGAALDYLGKIAKPSVFSIPPLIRMADFPVTMVFIVIFFLVEWFGRSKEHPLAAVGASWPRALRWALYYAIIIAVFWFSGERQQFIYFQF